MAGKALFTEKIPQGHGLTRRGIITKRGTEGSFLKTSNQFLQKCNIRRSVHLIQTGLYFFDYASPQGI
jgi:hypothetical protein